MNVRALACGAWIALAACTSKSVGELEKLKSEACACKDVACGESVAKQLEATIKSLPEPTTAEGNRIKVLAVEAAVCLRKLGGN
jgi:hypothetical protein